MRIMRPSGLSMAIVMLVSACGLAPTEGTRPLPADFPEAFGRAGKAFQEAAPLEGTVTPEAALARIRRMRDPPPFVYSTPLGQPIFGIVTCVDPTRCDPGSHPNGVWLILFPGQQPEDPVAWVVADGTAGGLSLSSDQ